MQTTLRPKWPPLGNSIYQQQLTANLNDLLTTTKLDIKCEQIEATIQQTLQQQRQLHNSTSTRRKRPTSDILDQLIQGRRTTTHRDTTTSCRLSKQIQKELRAIKRATRHAQVERILQEYRDLKKISGIKSRKQQHLITSMEGADGRLQRDLADVFATFYEHLYQDTHKHHSHNPPPSNMTTNQNNDHDNNDNSTSHIPPFTRHELQKSLKQMKDGKAADSNGIVAEMLKAGGDTLKEVLLDSKQSYNQPHPHPTTGTTQ